MRDIYRYVLLLNHRCEIILVVKDIYTFNQTRLVRAWGNDYQLFLREHSILNPLAMQQHSIKEYRGFSSLGSSSYHWFGKRVLFGNGSFNCFFDRVVGQNELKRLRLWTSPHKAYLQEETLQLNSRLLPDGLHGTRISPIFPDNRKIFYDNLNTEKPLLHGVTRARGVVNHEKMLRERLFSNISDQDQEVLEEDEQDDSYQHMVQVHIKQRETVKGRPFEYY